MKTNRRLQSSVACQLRGCPGPGSGAASLQSLSPWSVSLDGQARQDSSRAGQEAPEEQVGGLALRPGGRAGGDTVSLGHSQGGSGELGVTVTSKDSHAAGGGMCTMGEVVTSSPAVPALPV